MKIFIYKIENIFFNIIKINKMDKKLNNLILVLNCGSSSIKFAILNPDNKEKYLSGSVECLFLLETYITWQCLGTKHKKKIGANVNHKDALNFIIEQVFSQQKDIFKNLIGVGHRVVHGGTKIKKSTLIDSNIIECIQDASSFAPLHNPANLIGIKMIIEKYPSLSRKNIAVFDTSFYCNMPETSFLYAIPYNFYKKYGIRRYGAHGISHNYVAHRASLMLNKQFKSLNIITCHLGNGSSISAICNGICVDTSMGLTPLEGLVMGTRSGDLDPSIIFFMNNHLNLSIDKIETILNKKSGLLGLSGISSDFRYFEKKYYCKKHAKRSVDIFCHRLSKYIAAYTSVLENRLDAVIFTGGIGENVPLIRELVFSRLSLLGFKINSNLNLSTIGGKSGLITEDNSTPVFVITTDEELAIAQETNSIINRK
ncbi:acetate kinase [Buchnera aphidicola str. JF99 (Acyrthosiphon pisum)]|nr:acetate kinase [Buchnera aphidicola str. LL01 (Acyrthosiphon pisum)]ADP66570.1 acetate kinase [Buchnera aphidicola str. TLW03 (Acyrthosiphon pisum)]ADP67152.1 acetate kinase [Buchnera aphidicola str. JF99 (Acyrthosiphon pisum)]ADP67703.1 acetate kinase [Buchnera aphidicola str. JF98 (Acyrthosiphon pisum)]